MSNPSWSNAYYKCVVEKPRREFCINNDFVAAQREFQSNRVYREREQNIRWSEETEVQAEKECNRKAEVQIYCFVKLLFDFTSRYHIKARLLLYIYKSNQSHVFFLHACVVCWEENDNSVVVVVKVKVYFLLWNCCSRKSTLVYVVYTQLKCSNGVVVRAAVLPTKLIQREQKYDTEWDDWRLK